MSQPNDVYGRTITLATTGGQDAYTVATAGVTNFTVSFPTGRPQGAVYQTLNAIAPGSFVPPQNTVFQAAQFGQNILNSFAQSIPLGVPAGTFATALKAFQPFAFALQSGMLQYFLNNIGSIAVDGSVITSALIASWNAQITAYLAGN